MSNDGLEKRLCGLRTTAPSGVRAAVLIQGELADGYSVFPSPLGEVLVTFSACGISGCAALADADRFFAEHWARTGRDIVKMAPSGPLADAVAAALRQGDGRALEFDLRSITDFQRSVLVSTLTIPRGQVRSYAWVAASVGNPRAVRAAGSALAINPIPLLIPCHRVVRSDGKIGNYGMGGSAAKRQILTFEGVAI